MKLVDKLVASKALAGGALLPPTVGLSVNIPTFKTGASGSLPWAFSHVGTAAAAIPYFVSNLGANPIAHAYGIPTSVTFPGITMAIAGQPNPTGLSFFTDTDANGEQALLAAGNVTVSVIRGNPQANRAPEMALRVKLFNLAQ